MTRLTDGKKTIEITMQVWENDHYTPDFSNDFFEVGGLEYDNDRDAYRVEDVDYCIDYAMDWKNGTGDFCSDESTEGRDVDVTVVDELNDFRKRMIDEGGNIGWCKPYKDEKGIIKMAVSQSIEGGWKIVGLQIEGKDTEWSDEEIERASEILKNTYPDDYDGEEPIDILYDKVSEEMDCRDCPWFLECEAMDDE